MRTNKEKLRRDADKAFLKKLRHSGETQIEVPEVSIAKPFTLVPRETPLPNKKAESSGPKDTFLHLSDEPREFKPFAHLDPPKPKYFEQEEFLEIFSPQPDEKKVIITPEIFRALCVTAIRFGGVSLQELFRRFGDDVIPRNVDATTEEWPLPSPDTTRKILEFFSTFTPDQFTGSKRPWRHAQCDPPAEAPKPPN